MTSVALPASASTQVLNAEADLVRLAARGDAEAFGELYRRHSGPAWRLAQAVSADKDAAVAAFRDGFIKAVRAGRFGRRGPTGLAFRPHLLSAVYKSAIDQSYDRGPVAATRRAVTRDPDAALADAAFRSLPERWRAAVWLSDVENLDTDRLAAVLGVSNAVAEQLVARGRRGLAGRYAQSHRDAPEHIGDTLRPLALAIPANLADLTSHRFAASSSDRLPVLAPVTTWMEEKALRPMSVAVGALIGLGLIGLGVVPGNGTVRGQFGATGPSDVNGSVPVHTCFGLACPAGTTGAGSFSPTTAGGGSPSVLSAAVAGISSAGRALSTAVGSTQPSSSTGLVSSPAPGSSTPPSGPSGASTSGPTTVTVPGVASVTVSGTGTSVDVLGGAVTATVCSSGVGVTAGSTSAGDCGSSSTGTQPASSVVSTATNTITSVAKVLTTNVTSTVTTLPATVQSTVAGVTGTSGSSDDTSGSDGTTGTVGSTVSNTAGAVSSTVTDTTGAVESITSGL